MDSESYHIISLFSNGSYRAALSAYTSHPSPSPTLTLYAARSHLALSPPSPSAALQLLTPLPQTLDVRAVSALARYLQGEKEEAVGELEELLAEVGEQGLEEGEEEGRMVRGVVGTVWVLEGEERREEGIEVLREAVELGKDQECLAILSHLYISLNLPHLSTTLLTSPSTTSFTSDSLLSQLLIARSNLATGPSSKYQDAYYVFEEIKGMQGGRGEGVLAGVAVAQALLGRWEEARDATGEALEMNPSHPTSLANSAALALHTGKGAKAAEEALSALHSANPSHPLLADLAEMDRLFDEAATAPSSFNGPTKPQSEAMSEDESESTSLQPHDASPESPKQTGEKAVKKEDETSEGPRGNWEVAYVYAFLERLTDMIDPSELTFPHVMALEQALLDCSPPSQGPSHTKLDKPLTSLAGPGKKPLQPLKKKEKNGNGKDRTQSPTSSLSSLSASEADSPSIDVFGAVSLQSATLRASVEPMDPIPPARPENTPCPPHSELVKSIMLHFISLLQPLKELTDYHGKKTWFHFLINFVGYRLNGDVWGGGFRWRTNLLRTKGLKPGQENESMFWMLRWEDKVHLMRQMIDFILVNAPEIKTKIKDSYDLGNQRIAKRDPASNDLVLLPLGRTSTLLTIYKLDSSPRLYASGSPYKSTSPWVVICSTPAGYRAFIETLAEPTKGDKKKVGLKGPFKKALGVGGAGKGKGKEVEVDGKEEERILRARLEERLEEVEEWEDVQEALLARAARSAERAAARDARVARSLVGLGSSFSTRSSRLRSRGNGDSGAEAVPGVERPNYDEDDAGAVEDEEDGGWGAGGAGGRGKRRRVQRDAGGGGGDEDSHAGSEAGSVNGGGRGGSRRSSRKPVVPGERRSNRLQLKDEEEAEGEGEGNGNGNEEKDVAQNHETEENGMEVDEGMDQPKKAAEDVPAGEAEKVEGTEA
ncbi:hypothetical protein JCM11641_000109 [Rhodosporidiobolus odoratus]